MRRRLGSVSRALAVLAAVAFNLWALVALFATVGFSHADDSDDLIGTPQEMIVWFGLVLVGAVVAIWTAYEASRLAARRSSAWRYIVALAVASLTYGAWYASWPS